MKTAPSTPAGGCQVSRPESGSEAPNRATAPASFSATLTSVSPAITGGRGPATVAVTVRLSLRPSPVQTAPGVPHSRSASRVIETAPAPEGRTVTRHSLWLGSFSCDASLTEPPATVSTAPLTSSRRLVTSSLKLSVNWNAEAPSWAAGSPRSSAVSGPRMTPRPLLERSGFLENDTSYRRPVSQPGEMCGHHAFNPRRAKSARRASESSRRRSPTRSTHSSGISWKNE